MSDAGLDYEVLKVKKLFAADDYYIVPFYQRGYSWGDEEVLALLGDLSEAHEKYGEDAYLLGQIIVCPSTNRNSEIDSGFNQWDLIDGQQRCTTLYLMILVASQIIDSEAETPLNQIDKRFLGERESIKTVISSANPDIHYPRIRAASNGEEFLNKLLNSEELSNPDGPTQFLILNAVEKIKYELDKMEIEEIKKFLRFVLEHVYLIRLELKSATHAMRVFQKVNNRGLGLDGADLIKNFLFQKVDIDEYIVLSNSWDKASNTLYKARLKRVRSMEFLMKLLIGIRTGRSVPTGSLFIEWENLLGDDTSAAKMLASKLPENAGDLVRICRGELPQNGEATDLTTGSYMQSWIQQFEILLAGVHLTPLAYTRLLHMVEDRTMLSYWASEPSQAFERIIHPWAAAVRKLDPNPTIEQLIEAAEPALREFDDLSKRAKDGVCKLRYSVGSHRDRMRYVLARVNRRLQGQLNVSGFELTSLMRTTRGEEFGYDLDHIFPQASRHENAWVQNEELDSEFGNQSRYLSKIHSIGNMTLLHPQDNRNQSDAFPWEEEKMANFAGSELVSNRIMCPVSLWPNQQDRVTSLLTSYLARFPQTVSEDRVSWGEKEIDNRADFYWSVIMEDIKEHFNVI
jgi:hypothetical protein